MPTRSGCAVRYMGYMQNLGGYGLLTGTRNSCQHVVAVRYVGYMQNLGGYGLLTVRPICRLGRIAGYVQYAQYAHPSGEVK